MPQLYNMAEDLQTIPEAVINGYLDKASTYDGSFLSIGRQCVVYQRKGCPDQALINPNCGKCAIALKDQTVLIGNITARGFQHQSGPAQLWYTERVMNTIFTKNNRTLEVDHNAGQVNLTYQL